jgi:hypothetical protein
MEVVIYGRIAWFFKKKKKLYSEDILTYEAARR